MRLGIFGGSFDPVHRGHLLLAKCCADQAELDQVWFIPTAHQPLKPSGPKAPDDDRLAMLRRACNEHSHFVVSALEIERGGISYTVDTLELIAKEHPAAELFFLMGADSLADLPSWHRPGDICRLATPLVVHRAESPDAHFEGLRDLIDEDRLVAIRNQQVEMPPTPISSSEIRARIASGQDWQDGVPSAVADYIREHRLYTSS